MSRVTAYIGRSVVGAGGRDLGRVSEVLFHASEPRVVGLQIDPGAILGVIDRRNSCVLFGEVTPTDDGRLAVAGDKLPSEARSEKALGFGWDESVIWQRMPVRSAAGEEIGTVHDVVFDADSGQVTALRISTGTIGDAAVGRMEVAGDLVSGFDGDAVIVQPGYADISADGGAAKAVASGVTAVKVRGEAVADGMMQVGVAAAGALGRSLKSGVARKALDKMKSLMDDEQE